MAKLKDIKTLIDSFPSSMDDYDVIGFIDTSTGGKVLDITAKSIIYNDTESIVIELIDSTL